MNFDNLLFGGGSKAAKSGATAAGGSATSNKSMFMPGLGMNIGGMSMMLNLQSKQAAMEDASIQNSVNEAELEFTNNIPL